MKNYRKISAFFIGLLFVALSLVGFNNSEAQQQRQTTNSTSDGASTASPTPTPFDEEDDEVIKIETEAVNVLFTAQDKNRRLLTDLKAGDVKLFEDGQPQSIVSFARMVDLPLSLAILIDTSRSQERTLPEEKAAAKSFIESVVRSAKDEVAVVSFTGETTLEQGMTNNVARLGRAVDRVEFVPPANYIGGGVTVGGSSSPSLSSGSGQSSIRSAIWDAVWITSDEVLKPAPEKIRRAIILLTDGDDTYSQKKLNEAVDKALKSEAIVYCIGIGDPFTTTRFRNGIDDKSLKELAERTGGRAFFPLDEAELRKAFAQIQLEMRSQYLIAYEPANQKSDGAYRKIEIQLTNPELSRQKVALTHRQGYFAKDANPKTKK